MQETSWKTLGYEVLVTRDQSPSLKSCDSVDAEAMHHSGGALAESREIYGRLISETRLAVPCSPHFLSLGLGLGYNEALIAEALVEQNSEEVLRNWRCFSFEADPWLNQFFLGFLRGDLAEGEIRNTYESYFQKLKNPEKIKRCLLLAQEEARWVLGCAFSFEEKNSMSINGFLWDAFSARTCPELWDEEKLKTFLQEFSDSQNWSGFSSYASLGRLTRALKAAGYQVELRKGFHGKRNSTFAVRPRT